MTRAIEFSKGIERKGITLLPRADSTPPVVSIRCFGCGATSIRQVPDQPSPVDVVEIFRGQGWNDRGRRWTCPSCQTPATRRRIQADLAGQRPAAPPAFITRLPEAMPDLQAALDIVEAEMRATPERLVEVPPLTGRDILRVIGYLNLYFLDGQYVSGYSDRRIATELGVSALQVEQVRESSPYHGHIRGPDEPDDEREDVRSQLLALRDLVDEQIARIDAMAHRA